MLNKQQQEFYDLVIKGNFKQLKLLGEGGSGKSFAVSQTLKDYKDSTAITATTNKAASVLAEFTKLHTTTTHKHFGFTLVMKNYNQVLIPCKELESIDPVDLLIVEEVSMLPRKVYDRIQEALDEGIVNKVIYLGDKLQLPSPDKGILLDEIEGIEIHLTEQMRQQSPHKATTEYLQRLRDYIASGVSKLDDIDLIVDSPNIELIEDFSEFADKYNNSNFQKKILAHRNSVVNSYNKGINNNQRLAIGDRVVIDRPIGKLPNQSELIVDNLLDMDSYYLVDLMDDNGNIYYGYRNYKSNAALDAERQKYIDAENHRGYEEFMDRVIDLKQLYSCTIYKSQGSTYDEVFIDVKDLLDSVICTPSQYRNPMPVNLFLRLLYVAISRMRYKAYLFIGTTRDYSKLKSKRKGNK